MIMMEEAAAFVAETIKQANELQALTGVSLGEILDMLKEGYILKPPETQTNLDDEEGETVPKRKKIGLFPMTADILHAGHILALKEAKQHCETLIVALNCCPDNKQPIQSVYERYTQLMGCKYVDRVIPYAGEKDLELLLMTVEHDARVIGSDYTNQLTNQSFHWTGKDWEEMNGIHLLVIPRDHGLSSSELKNRIRTKEKPDTV